MDGMGVLVMEETGTDRVAVPVIVGISVSVGSALLGDEFPSIGERHPTRNIHSIKEITILLHMVSSWQQ